MLAENGRQAIDLIYQESFDGVLMDMQMPVMDGLVATREIRKDERFANLPILAMTANAMSRDRERCLEAGMQDHIVKPVDPNKMFSVLSQWIKLASPQPLPTTIRQVAQDTEEKERSAMCVPVIPGTNTQAALKRLGGNLKTYLKYLAKFYRNHGSADHAIREALSAQDMPTAQRIAHSLKGVSATLGMESLQKKAQALELVIKERGESEGIEIYLNNVAGELAMVCSALDQAFSLEEKTEIEPPPVQEEAQKTVDK